METVLTVLPQTHVEKNLLEDALKIGPVLNQYAEEEENNRRLSKPVIDILNESGFFRLFMPKSLGGIEADPVTTALVTEEISHHDTTAGWSVMIANSTCWWGGRIPEKGIETIYKNGPNKLIAAAFHPPMQATRVSGGYLINGRSPLASHVHDATWIFVTALIMEGAKIKMNDGMPEAIGVFMKANECEIIDTWYSLGMRGTDSNDVAAKDVFVPDLLFFPLVPEFVPNAHFKGPLYQYPAMGASVACLIPPIALAIARNAINEFKVLAEKKKPFSSTVPLRERGSIQNKVGKAEALLRTARAFLYQTISGTWQKIQAGEKIPVEEKAELLLAATHTVQSCAQAVDMMYSAAGSTAIYTKNKIERYFRDAQVIRQHGFFNESRYETVAQVSFGLPCDLPLVMF